MPPQHAPALAARASDRERPPAERAGIAGLLGTIGGPAAAALWDLLGPEQEPLLRVEAGRALRRLKAREGLGALPLAGMEERFGRLCDEIAVLNEAVAEERESAPVRAALYADHARLEIGLLLSLAALERDEEAMRRAEAGLFSESETRRANAIELLEVILPEARRGRLVPLLAPSERRAAGEGLREERRRRLLRSEPWTRAITLLNGQTGGEEMGEPDDKLARLLSTVTMLKQIELFREVSAHYLTSIAEIVEPVAMVAGEELFQEGDPGDACYLVCEGKVTVRAGGVEIATLGRGECLGELALLDGRPRCTRSMSVDGTPRSYSRPEASSDYLAWQRSRSSATGRTSFLLIRLGLSRSLTREA